MTLKRLEGRGRATYRKSSYQKKNLNTYKNQRRDGSWYFGDSWFKSQCWIQTTCYRIRNVSKIGADYFYRTFFTPIMSSLHQELYGQNFQNRITFFNWLRFKNQWNNDFLRIIIFSDEATFNNRGQVSSLFVLRSITRYLLGIWILGKSTYLLCIVGHLKIHIGIELLRTSILSQLVVVPIVRDRVIGSHFFDAPLNGEMYDNFLRHELPGLLNHDGNQLLSLQQDGVPPHFARQVRDTLYDIWKVTAAIKNVEWGQS